MFLFEVRATSCQRSGDETAFPCCAKLTGVTTRISGGGGRVVRETHVSITNANYCATRRRVIHLYDYGG